MFVLHRTPPTPTSVRGSYSVFCSEITTILKVEHLEGKMQYKINAVLYSDT